MAKEGLGLEITELRLGLPGGGSNMADKNEKKRGFSEIAAGERDEASADRKSQTKNQVVGWPPVCSYRRKNSFNDQKVVVYVKVSMDGAPFLRKMDLSMPKGYSDLAFALENLFGCFGMGEALKDGDCCEFAPIYEDKDGDWMLVGDVPWEMFVESCKRLRIMKKSDAMGFGLQPKSFLLRGTFKKETK
ncbi:AUX/IAA protein [Parasponia andersonii]|uniref:Auxin-responsive protein n=1 Tax=Parasponia andersonii TaxID=3476 RepID=A0A2P5CZ83_PARAD|nr:AUX/IAA protein [Parasponia andersonii]